MESRKGFTLIELMVVIMIVGILAAVAVPLMRGRVESAKWTEGKSMMGAIATAIRARVAETDQAPVNQGVMSNLAVAHELGFAPTVFDGTYFRNTDFSYSCTYDTNEIHPLSFTITCTKANFKPPMWNLTENGFALP